jgi:hypothetical protein
LLRERIWAPARSADLARAIDTAAQRRAGIGKIKPYKSIVLTTASGTYSAVKWWAEHACSAQVLQTSTLLSYVECIVYLNAEVEHRALNLGVSQ